MCHSCASRNPAFFPRKREPREYGLLLFLFLDSRLRGNDTLGLARQRTRGIAGCFIRLQCYQKTEGASSCPGGFLWVSFRPKEVSSILSSRSPSPGGHPPRPPGCDQSAGHQSCQPASFRSQRLSRNSLSSRM